MKPALLRLAGTERDQPGAIPPFAPLDSPAPPASLVAGHVNRPPRLRSWHATSTVKRDSPVFAISFAHGAAQVLRIVRLIIAILIGATVATPVLAQTTFTSRAAWEASITRHVTIDFEGIAPPGGFVRFNDGLTLSGVTFMGAGRLDASPHRLSVFGAGVDTFISAWSSGDMLLANIGFGIEGTSPGSISLPAGVTALGFNYAVTCAVTVDPACGSTRPWTVRLSTGVVLSVPGNGPPPNMSFWGIISPVPIASLQLDSPSSLPLLDNFSFQPAAVPLLPTWGPLAFAGLLTLAGIVSLGRRRWAG
jgi:hypothetical protein